MNKHAYLVIAHNEFEVLQKLVSALDDHRNDIYIHFDKKVQALPIVKATHSPVHIISNRVAVYWGHVSQVKAEYALMEAASSGMYSRYHIVSGTHMPLVSQNTLHDYFNQHAEYEVLQVMEQNPAELQLKLNRYNLFMQWFQHNNPLISRVAQIAWRASQFIQVRFNIQRNNTLIHKASNWVSLTAMAVEYMLTIKSYVLKKYNYSMCADELFIPTELSSAPETFNLLYSHKFLKHSVIRSTAYVYTLADYDMLINSGCLFARKFSAQHINVVNKILKSIH